MPRKKKKAEAIYRPTEKAVESPRLFLSNDLQVGIGGSVTVEKKPPKRPVIYPEATPDQYRQLFEAGQTSLIEKVEEGEGIEDDQVEEND